MIKTFLESYNRSLHFIQGISNIIFTMFPENIHKHYFVAGNDFLFAM
jgi:hypothetical protein